MASRKPAAASSSPSVSGSTDFGRSVRQELHGSLLEFSRRDFFWLWVMDRRTEASAFGRTCGGFRVLSVSLMGSEMQRVS